MAHHTKDKGDIATTQAIADLTKKGYTILTPTVSEHLPFDFIAYKDGKMFRIQSKFRSNGKASEKTSWTDKHGNHSKYYNNSDFDYYALYLPEIEKVVYPSIDFAGCKIRASVPNSPTPFYWYKDFLEFTDNAEKRTYKDEGFNIQMRNKSEEPTEKETAAHIKARKVSRPSKEELTKLLWEIPTLQLAKQFGVSDKAIEKWSKAYGISKPPRGHWIKIASKKPLTTPNL